MKYTIPSSKTKYKAENARRTPTQVQSLRKSCFSKNAQTTSTTMPKAAVGVKHGGLVDISALFEQILKQTTLWKFFFACGALIYSY